MSETQPRKIVLIGVLTLLVLVALGLPLLMVGSSVLESGNAAEWATAGFTGGIAIMACLALLPAGRQTSLASKAVKAAASASAESHRPYVTLMIRASIEGIMYLELVNHGDRAALGLSARFDSPPLHQSEHFTDPKSPFGNVSYLAPNERRSLIYSGGRDSDRWPPELVVALAYTGEDGTAHAATVTHDMNSLKPILINPDNLKTPTKLLNEGLAGIRSIARDTVQQVSGQDDRDSRPLTLATMKVRSEFEADSVRNTQRP